MQAFRYFLYFLFFDSHQFTQLWNPLQLRQNQHDDQDTKGNFKNLNPAARDILGHKGCLEIDLNQEWGQNERTENGDSGDRNRNVDPVFCLVG